MKVLKIYAAGEIKIKEIDNTLKSLQTEVGGKIECVRLFADDDITTLANEEGRILELPHNQSISGVRGDVIIVGVAGEEFCDLPDSKIDTLLRIFKGEANE